MKLPILLLFAAIPALQAKDDAARLMLKSESGADIQIVSTSDNAKSLDPQPKGVTIDMPVNPSEWSTGSVKFKVTEDTDLRLRLSAVYTKADDKWVFIDNVKAEGVALENPDFEAIGPKAAPSGWKFLQNGKGTASQVQDPKVAASGQACVKVSHGCPVVQTIHVPKDTEVTLTFSGKSAPAE